MHITPHRKPGTVLFILALALFFAGCTQPSPATPSTPVPTATIAAGTVPPMTPAPVANETRKAGFAALAQAFACELDGKAIAAVRDGGPNPTAFSTVLEQLKAFRGADPRIACVYTLEQQNGTVWFIVGANDGLPDGSGYPEVYETAPPALKSPVTEPVGLGPYTDTWGNVLPGVCTGRHRLKRVRFPAGHRRACVSRPLPFPFSGEFLQPGESGIVHGAPGIRIRHPPSTVAQQDRKPGWPGTVRWRTGGQYLPPFHGFSTSGGTTRCLRAGIEGPDPCHSSPPIVKKQVHP